MAVALREMRRVDEEMKKREKVLQAKTEEPTDGGDPDDLDSCERYYILYYI